jgi:hypothetical protein
MTFRCVSQASGIALFLALALYLAFPKVTPGTAMPSPNRATHLNYPHPAPLCGLVQSRQLRLTIVCLTAVFVGKNADDMFVRRLV